MSERMTAIRLSGHFGSGWAEYGRKTVPEMLAAVRERAKHQHDEACAILAAADDEFCVETYLGIHVRREREVLQPGRPSQTSETGEA